jgi:beta-glucuronidase
MPHRPFSWTRLIGAATLVATGAATARAEAPPGPDPLITNVEGRRATSLNGSWRTIVDALERGYYDYRYQPRADGYFQDRKPRDETDRVEYDFDTSPTLQVPGDWNTQRESLLYYEGTVWYRRLFDDPRQGAGSRLFVWFGAVASRAHVFLNGDLLGFHEGAFTPFNFEITDRVKPEGNVLIVRVNGARRADTVPTLDFDWWNYGGITRSVRLVEVPGTFVRDYSVQLANGARDRVRGWVQLDGMTAGPGVTVRIPEAGVVEKVTAGPTGRAELDFVAPLELWSPGNPKLYEIEIAAGRDLVRDRVGFRTVETRGTEILLNGEPLFLRGICVHGEAPYRAARAFGADDARTLLGWAEELGANFVRLAHYPHDEAMVREADRRGLLVWSEIPVYWAIDWENPGTLDNARTQLTENITRDRNRASVVLWSVANETPISDARNAFLQALVNRVRELDDTRLVTAALERGEAEGDTQVIDDPFGRHLDVIGCNEYVGWYDGLPDKADRVSWRTVYDKPHIMSEWGAGARYGLHGTARTRWSEEYQAEVYRRTVKMLERIPFLAGTTPWLLMDFRSPHRVLPGVQDGWNRKGVVSDRGQRKKAFFVLQEWYRSLQDDPEH